MLLYRSFNPLWHMKQTVSDERSLGERVLTLQNSKYLHRRVINPTKNSNDSYLSPLKVKKCDFFLEKNIFIYVSHINLNRKL